MEHEAREDATRRENELRSFIDEHARESGRLRALLGDRTRQQPIVSVAFGSNKAQLDVSIGSDEEAVFVASARIRGCSRKDSPYDPDRSFTLPWRGGDHTRMALKQGVWGTLLLASRNGHRVDVWEAMEAGTKPVASWRLNLFTAAIKNVRLWMEVEIKWEAPATSSTAPFVGKYELYAFAGIGSGDERIEVVPVARFPWEY